MIPMYYGGIDRIYGDVSIECADKILDIVDNYTEIFEAVSDKKIEGEVPMELRKPEDVIIGDTTLEEILRQDSTHINLRGADLSYVDLYHVDLRYADLSYVDLSYSELRGAVLSYATLTGACLCNANLYNADLSYSKIKCANLSYAILQGANLVGSDLSHSDLRHADLQCTRLEGANLYCAIGDSLEYRRGKILTESIIAYKVCTVKDDSAFTSAIVTLEIPRGAIVFSINGKKCRTNKAKVISVGDGFADRAYSLHKYMSYYVGDEFTVYDFNCEYNVGCAKGIHFFMTREEAINYTYEYEKSQHNLIITRSRGRAI